MSGVRTFQKLSAITLLILSCLNVANAGEDNGLIIWIPPNEIEYFKGAAGRDEIFPEPGEIESFFRDVHKFFKEKHDIDLSIQIRLSDVCKKALQDEHFARQVLGQKMIFQEINKFIQDYDYKRIIEIRFFDWEELLEILENMALGEDNELPHLIAAPSTWIAHLASKGVLIPIEADRENYVEQSLETCMVKRFFLKCNDCNYFAKRIFRIFGADYGKSTVYALPFYVDVRFFYYWKSLFPDRKFDNRGIFEEILNSVVKKQRNEEKVIPPLCISTEMDWDLLHFFSLVLWGAGGDWNEFPAFLQEEPSDDAVDSLNRLHGNNDLQKACYLREKRSTIENRFLKKEFGSMITGLWMLAKLKHQLGENWNEQVGIELPPFNVNGPKKTFIGGLHLALSPRAENNEYAVEFIKFLTTESVQRHSQDIFIIPGDKKAFDDIPDTPVNRILKQGVKNSKYYPRFEEWASIESELTRNQLFCLFKHISEGQKELSKQDIEAVQGYFGYLGRKIYFTPLIPFLAILIFVILAITVRWWYYGSKRRLKKIISKINPKYKNFTVTIDCPFEKEKKIYKTAFIKRSRGWANNTVKETVNLNSQTFTLLRQYAADRANLSNIQTSELKKFGNLLAEIALPGKIFYEFNEKIRQIQKKRKKLRLRLNIECDELRELPWEYLYFNPDELKPGKLRKSEWMRKVFLGLNPDVSIVRFPEFGTKKVKGFTRKLKILIVISNPAAGRWVDLANAEKEEDIIRTAFSKKRKVSIETLKKCGNQLVTAQNLLQTIQSYKPDIIHLIMHGCPRNDPDVQEDSLVMESQTALQYEYFSLETFLNRVREAHVKMLVFSACYIGGSELLSTDTNEIPLIIGSRFELPENCGLIFTKAFYEAFSDHLYLDECISSGRQYLYADQIDELPVWGHINFYCNSNKNFLWI